MHRFTHPHHSEGHGEGGHGHGHGRGRCGRGHHGGGHGRHGGFRGPFGPHMMAGFGGHGGRARRGDVRAAILRLLAEEPMHGYQIIQELGSRSGGAWRPSPGSVYPTLQLLEDEGLIVGSEAAGKRVFSLTEEGTAAVAKTADRPAPWDERSDADEVSSLREAAGRLMPAIMQVGQTGTPEQIAATMEILNDARKRIYALLAED